MAERSKTSSKKSTTKNNSAESKASNQIRNDKFKVIFGLLLIAISIYLLIAFASFLFCAGADQSILKLGWLELIKNPEIKVKNITGKSGAWIANVFINTWFGISSFIFIYLMIIFSLKLLSQKVPGLLSKTIKALILILWLSVTLGYAFESRYHSASLYPGGTYGYYVAIWLNSFIGKVGTFFVLLVSLLIYLVFVVEGFVNYFKQPFLHKLTPDTSVFKKKDDSSMKETNSEKKDKKIENLVFNKFSDDAEPSILKEKVQPNEDIGFDISEGAEDEAYDEGSEDIADDSLAKGASFADKQRVDNDTDVEDDLGLVVDNQDGDDDVEWENHPPMDDYDPTLDLTHYHYPPIDLLEDYSHLKSEVSDEELIENKNKIVETLKNFKIEIVKIKATIGPTVTLYEIIPAQGIRISKIKNLEDDIALSLSALGIRIIAPIPGKGTIGIEVPNRQPQVVSMRSIIASKKFQETTAELPVAMGRTISNEIFIFDLAKMPHLLVAGATGQGKSVGLNAIIASILYKKHPSQVKFVFIDPKKVELNLYAIIEKHFLAKLPDADEPIITDVEKVKATLNSVGIEMDNRYELLKSAHTRNLKEYNRKFIQRKLNPEKGHRYLPYIIVVIDEFADLIMTAGKEIEFPIARIAQLARAIGIHMVIATQRPSTNIITGTIKANFPSRIAFKVASMIDSRTILDSPGANQLVGKGDMLFSSGSELVRLQCALVDTPEVERICEHIASQQSYPSAYILPECLGEDIDSPGTVDMNQKDEFFDDAARLVVLNQQGSTSMIQRRFSIGYNRAGRIMDQLEKAGIVGPSEGSKARKVYFQDEYSLEQKLNSL
jgi:DNA segregation ATPase FtsK/SpoIIIE, S-DNA-T family